MDVWEDKKNSGGETDINLFLAEGSESGIAGFPDWRCFGFSTKKVGPKIHPEGNKNVFWARNGRRVAVVIVVFVDIAVVEVVVVIVVVVVLVIIGVAVVAVSVVVVGVVVSVVG